MSETQADKEQERFWNEFRVGVFAVGAIVLAVVGFQFLKGDPLFGGTYTLTATFEQADGVTTDVPVTVRGIAVGRVADVALTEDGVRVKMQVQNDVELREGTTASVTGVAALDDVSVSLQRNEEGPLLSDGDRVPTQNENTLDQLRNRAVPIAEHVDSVLTTAGGALNKVDALIGGSKGDVEKTLSNLRSASSDVQSLLERDQDRLHRTIAHLERTTASMDTLARDLQSITSNNRDTLAQATRDLSTTLARTRRASKSIEQSARHLDHVLQGLREGKGTAGRLLTDPRLYESLNSVTVQADSLLNNFQEDPGRYLDTTVEIF